MISNMIGTTPLLEIKYKYKGQNRLIYAKAEYFNLTGSIKDRMAYYIIKNAYEEGSLTQDMPIIEATSGNTGIAFSAIGTALGHDVHIFMPDWMSKERIALMESFGATVHLVTHEQGGFIGCIELADKLAKEINGFRPQQFSNKYNPDAHYNGTGLEIVHQFNQVGSVPNAFVAGVGTGGTVMGIGKCLKEYYPKIKINPLEPSNSPILTVGKKVGKHRIQGISDEFIPPIVELEKLDNIVSIDDGDAIIMTQMLSKKLGLGVGISSGANFLGAVKLQNEFGNKYQVVTVFSDDNKKYLSTDLMKSENVKKDYFTNNIELIEFRSLSYKPLKCLLCNK